MKANAARFTPFFAGLMILLAAGWLLAGSLAKPVPEGFPTDWSHRHVIFSQPATAKRAELVGRDPRFWQQWYRRNTTRFLAGSPHDKLLRPAIRLRPPNTGKLKHDWSEDMGTGASAGAGNFPAKYSFQITTASCGSSPKPDYVVFNTGLLGSSGQADILAYDNLYTGCTAPAPAVYWAYNTGGQVVTSPVISGDGSQIAFVQTTGGFAVFVVLKWAAGTGTAAAPATPTLVTPANYYTCTAPCMTQVQLMGGGSQTTDSNSSPFVDYTDDVAWVGGNPGYLHKIQGVFRGAPAEVATGGFPVNLGTTWISSPVFDFVTKNVFVGDSAGFLHSVNSSSGTVVNSAQLEFALGLVAAPIVDSTAGKVWVFISNDGSINCAGSACAAVDEFTTGFTSMATGSPVTVGNSSATPNVLYEGGFDSAYVSSADTTGNLYVCGNTGGSPTIYQVQISGGNAGPVVAGPTLTGATAPCSPVTDVSNPNVTSGPSEWIFAGVQGSGSGSNCASGGCVMNFYDQPWKASTVYALGQEVLDSNFGIEVVSKAGTSDVAAPTWGATVGGTTNDNSVRWLNQGPLAVSYSGWTALTNYGGNAEIIDSNGNIEFTALGGLSGLTAPTPWNTAVDGSTDDGTVRWRNVGPVATASQAATGGTSAIIMDNVIITGGSSQIYYSTLSDQVCGISGTGGCAVQTSQSALQ